MSHKSTLILVPGAWHGPDIWDKITPLLEAQHYKCICIELPSATSDPSKTLLDDINAARGPIVTETQQGRDVVVVVHSYGGFVGPSAIKGLTSPTDGSAGQVIGIVYIASGFVPAGLSFLQALGGVPPPIWRIDSESGFAELVGDPREMFYHDIPREEGEERVRKLRGQSLRALTEGGEHVYAGWLDVPSWFLLTTEDRAGPVEGFRLAVHFARDKGASVTTREIAASHSPMLSRPEEVVGFLVEAATDFVGRKG